MAPRGPSLPHGPPHGRRVPGEAALAVVAALAHGEHAGVGRAGEEEVAHVEGSQRAEPPALARAAEALQAAAGLGAHAGGAAAARCGARASREGGRRAALRPPPAFKELGRSLARSARGGCCALAAPRSRGRAGGRAVPGCAGRESACTHQADPARLLRGKDTSPKASRPPPAVPADGVTPVTRPPLRSRLLQQGLNECDL